MGSGDLNMKKSWHPQRSGNVAATQKAEAEAIAERKKLQQRLQEIEEERKKEELQKALEAAGGKPKPQRVEWMYSGPTDGQAGDAAENEAYLLGKRRIDKLLQDNDAKKLQKQSSVDAVAAAPAAAVTNARDIAAKIWEDPLLAIKRQEQQAYEAMMNDPIRRRQLLASMGVDDSQDKSKRKEERRHKHRHSHHRSHRRHDDDRDGERHSRRRRSDSRDRSRSPRRYDSEEEDRRRRRRDSPGRHDRRRDRSESADSRDRRDRRDDRFPRSSRDRQDRRDRRDGSRDGRYKDGRSRTGSRSLSPASRRRDYSPDRDGRRRKDYSPDRDTPRRRGYSRGRPGSSRRYSEEPDGYRNGNASNSRRNHDGRPVHGPPRHDRRPGSADAEREKAEQEERARKLAAMQDAATDLDKDRERRLALIAEQERAAQESDERARQRNKRFGGDARFMNQLHNRAAELKVADRAGRR
ncbi:Pre-mRNA splicing factor-domain-containing protein [Achaetomium macrosporum]|uniref:Pre-mRNA splicing factor-domain-containing protein n=1 Tax=Achaetomium macrosporum TaxID=79813 RepID=A0AAN7HA95_9PEZI|nr:Pre-mRNA splicing factor-domain-containing protein [Achaetomium macrosporum]